MSGKKIYEGGVERMEVNSVLPGIQSSYVTTNKKTQNKTVENTEFSEAQKLEAFKKEIWRDRFFALEQQH